MERFHLPSRRRIRRKGQMPRADFRLRQKAKEMAKDPEGIQSFATALSLRASERIVALGGSLTRETVHSCSPSNRKDKYRCSKEDPRGFVRDCAPRSKNIDRNGDDSIPRELTDPHCASAAARKEITASRGVANGHRRIFQSRRGGRDRNGIAVASNTGITRVTDK